MIAWTMFTTYTWECGNMAEKLTNTTVKLGNVIPVKNVDRKNWEVNEFISIQIEDREGDNERCLLFTQLEYSLLKDVVLPCECTKALVTGRLYPAALYGRDVFFVRVIEKGTPRLVQIGKTILAKVDKRAKAHPKSVTKKSLIRDLLD